MPEETEIELLPALPAQWADGSFSGVHVRGGAIIDLSWAHGRVTAMKMRAKSNGRSRLILPQGQSIASVRSSDGRTMAQGSDGFISMKSGDTYTITFR